VTVDRAELRRLADAATPGPWEAVVLGSEGYEVRAPALPWKAGAKVTRRPRVARCGYEEWAVDRANAEYVAAVDPAVVLELLGVIDQLEALCECFPECMCGGDRAAVQTSRIRAVLRTLSGGDAS